MKNILTLISFLLLQLHSVYSLPPKIESNPNKITGVTESMKINLYAINTDGTISLQDGNKTVYDSSFSNDIDLNDFKKINNFAENLAIVRNGINLAIEKRQPLNETDTIFLKMWQMRQKSYQLELIATAMDHPGLTAYLEDSYLQTATPVGLNTTTTVSFTINTDAASASMTRFRVIFKTAGIAVDPVTICSFKAVAQNQQVLVKWTAKNETNIKEYSLEKSVDGHQFLTAVNITAVHNKSAVSEYQYVDRDALPGDNYYRIKNVYSTGKTAYSKALKVSVIVNAEGLTVFPNPATGSSFSIQLNHMPAGIYSTRLLNNFGQVVAAGQINYSGGALINKIETGRSLSKGTYHLEVANQAGLLKSIKVLVLNQ